MKIYAIIISVLFIIFGLGCYLVLDKGQETNYNCTVLTIGEDGQETYRTGKFTSSRLKEIRKDGGAILGEHFNQLHYNDGVYSEPIFKTVESFTGAVVCAKDNGK